MLILTAIHKHDFFNCLDVAQQLMLEEVELSQSWRRQMSPHPVWRLLLTCHTSSYVHLSMLHLDSSTETTADVL